jgi:hypothetical protein
MKELAEALRQIRLAFPASADFRYQRFFNAIDRAEAELERFRMGLSHGDIVIPVAAALKTAGQPFPGQRSYQSCIVHAEKLLRYLQTELSREAFSPTSPATPAS